MTHRDSGLTQGMIQLPDGRPRLAVRQAPGERRPMVLVHGLASNARLWDGVSAVLQAAGHQVVSVDQRGHGLSDVPDDGYDTDTCADDLAALLTLLDFTGPRTAVVAGQSWGGNVVLSLAARHPGSVAAVCCVDGGWLSLHDRFATFEECWAALAPPVFDHMKYADLAGWIRQRHSDWPADGVEATLANLIELPDGTVRARLSRDHHREIVRSLYQGDPGNWYPKVDVPVLLCPAGSPDGAPRSAVAVSAALEALPDARVRWYPGADHDLHAQHPDLLAADLIALAESVEAGSIE